MAELATSIVIRAKDLASGVLGRVAQSSDRLGRKAERLRDQLARVEGVRAKISAFRRLKEESSDVAGRLAAAQDKVKALAGEMKAARRPSRALSERFAKARAEARRLKDTSRETAERLERLRRQLHGAGVDTRKMSGAWREAGKEADRLRGKLSRLDGRLARRRGGDGTGVGAAGGRGGGLFGGGGVAERLAAAGLATQALGGARDMLGGAVARPFEIAARFEEAFADVRKVVDFGSKEMETRFAKRLRAMSQHLPVTAEGLAAIAAAGGQLGIAAADLPPFVETVAKMATAFDMTDAEAGEAMAKLANVYRIPMAEMEGLGDVINHLSDNTAAKAGAIVSVLGRIGGTARTFGLSARQAAALGDAMIALGEPPERAGTAINAMLSKLQTASEQGRDFQDALAAMGTSAAELETAIAEDAQGALSAFFERLETLDKADRAKVLTKLFGAEHQDSVGLLTGSLDEYRKALRLVNDEAAAAGSLQREFDNKAATANARLAKLRNRVAELWRTIGDKLVPVVSELADALGPLVSAAAGWVEAHPTLVKWALLAAGALAMLLAILVPLSTLVLVLAPLLSIVAVKVLLVVAAAAALAAVAYLAWKNWEPLGVWFANLWERIKAAFWGGVASILEAVQSVASNMPDWALPEGLEADNLAASVARYRELADASKRVKPVDWHVPDGAEVMADITGALGIDALTAQAAPALAGPAAAAQAPAAGPASVTNTAHITINAAAADARQVAEEVRRQQDRLARTDLHDGGGG